MATPAPIDRLRQAVASAAQQVRSPTAEPPRPQPAPGDLYVLGTVGDAAIEWLVVREHPDEPQLVLLAPTDDFPLVGLADEVLPLELVGRPLVVRCGEACWVPAVACPDRLRTGMLPEGAVLQIRRNLAMAARGASPAARAGLADADPEYLTWISTVSRTREALQRRADCGECGANTVIPVGRFSPTPPANLAVEPPLTLAASPGGLMYALGRALDDSCLGYWECEAARGTRFLLTADTEGVRVTWLGNVDIAPPRLTALGLEGRTEAAWQPGSKPDHFHAAGLFPWIDGQVTFTLDGETDTPRSWTIRL